LGKILAIFRAILVVLYTGWQILLLATESLFRGASLSVGYRHRGYWGRNTMRIEGIKLVEKIGQITVPVALIVSNHRSLLDPVIQAAYINAHIIAKDAVGNLPMIGKGARMTGIVFVKREKLRSRLAARNATKELLEQGISVLVYAEGTTGTNKTTNGFKSGTFALATELGIPVIPVAIEYPKVQDFWTSGGMGAQMMRQTGKWNTKAKLRFGEPLYGSDPRELMKETQKWIDTNLAQMQEGWSEMFPS
jgi:1-acyl-sn-glycerol-3-phosphate acyltransferase